MPITTIPVAISTLDITGTPLPGGLVRFTLNAPDSEGDTVIPTVPRIVSLDANGSGSVNLWPNALGTGATSYSVLIQDQYGVKRLDAVAFLPNAGATTLAAILRLTPPPSISEALAVLQEAQDAATQCQAILAQVEAVGGPPGPAGPAGPVGPAGPPALSITGYFPGSNTSVPAGQRLYPGVTGTLNKLQAWASQAVVADTTIAIQKNGAAFASVTILAGQTTASVTLALAITSADYLTASLAAASAAINAGFRADLTL